MKLSLTGSDIALLAELLELEADLVTQDISSPDSPLTTKELESRKSDLLALVTKLKGYEFNFDAAEIELMLEVIGLQAKQDWRNRVEARRPGATELLAHRKAQFQIIMNRLDQAAAMV